MTFDVALAVAVAFWYWHLAMAFGTAFGMACFTTIHLRYGLRNSARDCSCCQLSNIAGIVESDWSKVLADGLVDHEVESDVWRDTSDGRYDTAIECGEASFGLVHQCKCC